jgi:CheY-like chemotaxis protein
MPLILAIEPDRRQANTLNAVVKGQLHADLVLADSADEALAALGDRVPDLILTTALLSPTDEVVLGERLRTLNGVAAHVQTLTIPVLAAPRPRVRARAAGMLAALRRGKAPKDDAPDGCDPTVFASQCAEYLERAAAERAASATADRRHEPADGDLSYVPTMIEPPSSIGEADVIDEFEASLAEVEPIAEPAESAHEPIVNFMTSMLDPIETGPEPMVNSLTAGDEAPETTQEPLPIARNFSEVDHVVRPASVPLIIDAPAAAATVQHAIAQIEALVAREALATETIAKIEADEHVDDASDSDIPEGFIELDLSTLVEDPPADSLAVREEDEPAAIETSEFEDENKPLVYDLNAAADSAESRAVFSVRPASKRLQARKKPVKDEWAFFDPDKCGFAALLAKLDEIIDKPA